MGSLIRIKERVQTGRTRGTRSKLIYISGRLVDYVKFHKACALILVRSISSPIASMSWLHIHPGVLNNSIGFCL